MTVYAQTPSFSASLPALPPLAPQAPKAPEAASPYNAGNIVKAPTATAAAPATNKVPTTVGGMPVLGLPPLPGTDIVKENVMPEAPALAPESSEVGSQSSDAPTALPPLDVAAATAKVGIDPNKFKLPVPKADTTGLPSEATMIPPAIGVGITPDTTTSLPEIKVVRDKPAVKSWMTRLAPTEKVMRADFNYRRNVLPGIMYRPSDDDDVNAHLPRLYTRDDYANMLFHSVARNDVEATRALLNAGTGINVTNVEGETPLMLARRAGSMDVAALLIARGGK